MIHRSAYVDHCLEMLRPFGAVDVKPMFGGWGLYREGVFFALIAADTLFLKADAECVAQFDAESLPPFVYESKVGERIVTSYRRAPDDALEDPEVMVRWARIAYGAALRAPRAKTRARKAETP